MEQQVVQTPPEGHENVEKMLRIALSVSPSELERREAAWQAQKSGTKKKSKPSAEVRAAL